MDTLNNDKHIKHTRPALDDATRATTKNGCGGSELTAIYLTSTQFLGLGLSGCVRFIVLCLLTELAGNPGVPKKAPGVALSARCWRDSCPRYRVR